MQQDEHPSKLIDLELLNLLKFCGDLFTTYKHNNEDYQEEIMLKSIELGKKQKQKVLVLDMDETMVSARFKSRMQRMLLFESETSTSPFMSGSDLTCRIAWRDSASFTKSWFSPRECRSMLIKS